MRSRVQSAAHLLKGGRDWESVVKNHSDDKEEDAPIDGAYVFGRERAVQPFDRISHSAQKGKLTDPFLTVYGFHVLQITDYERGELAKDDKTHVSHVLAMYPALRTLNSEGGDVRAEIKNITAAAPIQVLEPGLKNMVPPKYRDQIID